LAAPRQPHWSSRPCCPSAGPACSRTQESSTLIGRRIRGSKLSAPPSLGGPRFRSMQAVVLPCQGHKTRLRVDKHHHFAIRTALPRHTHLKFPHFRPHTAPLRPPACLSASKTLRSILAPAQPAARTHPPLHSRYVLRNLYIPTTAPSCPLVALISNLTSHFRAWQPFP
jgi:hypothetical protein